MWTRIAILAVIGGLIGWITNVLAIKLIFRPIQAIRIPIINYKIQGIIPKRRNELAKSVGGTIEKELISIEEILEKLLENQDKSEIVYTIKSKIDQVVNYKIPSFLPKSIKDVILSYINDIIEEELEPTIDQIIQKVADKAIKSVKIGEMVEQKINELDLLELEKIVIEISNRELKQIEILGGILGFFIGIIQGVLVHFI
ncbi:DUF445 domain-containing protein [Garciella nitratireducens]|uniref:DUF445 family protein n=1 Tax=Garciella nitratireducens DSM 15102 TaxID=1121911 RepID=A0A1T4KS96_9FIRM|nr:DUF445 family protein [Garciella nitratireducens]RBP39546.1 uncharacterized protein DUF445 [Garciella nitratireducens]SJZ45197.1 Protein of unknown function [Garciella nitratireducens DSM 15102]